MRPDDSPDGPLEKTAAGQLYFTETRRLRAEESVSYRAGESGGAISLCKS